MNEEQETAILRILNDSNEWWLKGAVSAEKNAPYKRKDYYKLTQELGEPRINAIIGPRQVGKTTLMHQLIQFLIENRKTPPNHMAYIQLDTVLNQPNLKDTTIDEILNAYSKNIAKKPLNELKETTYFFLDEVQKVKDWPNQLKILFDRKLKIKFTVSGSSSNNILKGSAEALTGRLSINILMPLKFIDFYCYPKENPEITAIGLNLRKSLENSITRNNPQLFYEQAQQANKELIGISEDIQIKLEKYLVAGGYPLTLKKEGITSISKELYDYAFLSIYRDIVMLFEIRNAQEINQLLVLIAQESPHTESYESIGKELNMQAATVKKYLGHLEDIFLITQSSQHTKNVRKRQKSLKKIYILDNGIRNALLGKLNDNTPSDFQEMGALAETTLNNHLRRLKFNIEKTPNPQIDYWKNGHEIDNVVTLSSKPIPIECKYKNDITPKDIKGLKEFGEKFKPPMSIIITKNTIKKEDEILFVPLWLFLLAC
ncbi:MAG: ATP-binding protein [Candidatus Diapherotrites archaeon]|nr:ATP-binding protein [Candidatus Diapherotrites archaeon]